MDKQALLQRARIYALVTEMAAVKAFIAGMQVDNAEMESMGGRGASPPWRGWCFFRAAKELRSLARQLRDEIKEELK